MFTVIGGKGNRVYIVELLFKRQNVYLITAQEFLDGPFDRKVAQVGIMLSHTDE